MYVCACVYDTYVGACMCDFISSLLILRVRKFTYLKFGRYFNLLNDNLRYAVYAVQYTLYSVYCTVYSVQYIPYSVKRTVYICSRYYYIIYVQDIVSLYRYVNM